MWPPDQRNPPLHPPSAWWSRYLAIGEPWSDIPTPLINFCHTIYFPWANGWDMEIPIIPFPLFMKQHPQNLWSQWDIVSPTQSAFSSSEAIGWMVKSKAPQPIGAMDSNKMQLVLFFEDAEASILGQVGIFNWYVWHMNIYISKLPILNQDILGIWNSWAKRLSLSFFFRPRTAIWQCTGFRHATSSTRNPPTGHTTCPDASACPGHSKRCSHRVQSACCIQSESADKWYLKQPWATWSSQESIRS